LIWNTGRAGDLAGRAHDGIARAHQNGRIVLDRPGTVLELAGKAVVHALEAPFARLAEVKVGEQPPGRDRQLAHERLLDLAEPAHEPRHQTARNSVGEQEVDVLLLAHFGNCGPDCHETVRLPR
jgi:hypothetical protein